MLTTSHRRYFARVKNAAPLNRLLYVDLKTFLPCLNLDNYRQNFHGRKTSKCAVPFLNRQMIEFAARMPPDLKLRGFKRKYILKRALEKLLPREVVWRKKAGFGAPIRSWLPGLYDRWLMICFQRRPLESVACFVRRKSGALLMLTSPAARISTSRSSSYSTSNFGSDSFWISELDSVSHKKPEKFQPLVAQCA